MRSSAERAASAVERESHEPVAVMVHGRFWREERDRFGRERLHPIGEP